MLAYASLGLAVICEVFGDSMMKLSNGFAKKLPIIGVAAGYIAAFILEAQALNHLPVGFVYAAWTGLGVALTAIVGAVFWKEKVTPGKVVGTIAIIAGVLVMKMGV